MSEPRLVTARPVHPLSWVWRGPAVLVMAIAYASLKALESLDRWLAAAEEARP